MGIEIERKFLVNLSAWRPSGPGTDIVQGYICSAKERVVRVRVAGAEARLTIKGESRGISRPEYEYAIPSGDAREMLESLCELPLVEKSRHLEEYAGRTWEIDVFRGENEGLVVAEVELEAADAPVELPPWAGKEVSEDRRYSNSRLAKFPFKAWAKEDPPRG
jgi:adenylate cyclase